MKGISAVLVIVSLVVIAPLAAETKTGNVNPNKDAVFQVFSFFGGQLNTTLTWSKKSADLFLVMVCSDGITTLEWGVAAAEQDRVQRLDVGVLAGLTCLVGVAAFSGGSKFALNIQETLDAEPTKALSKRRHFEPAAPPWAETRALIAKTKSLGRLRN